MTRKDRAERRCSAGAARVAPRPAEPPQAPRTLRLAAARIVRAAGGPIDAAVVCGSGLGDLAAERVAGVRVGYAALRAPASTVPGHASAAYAGTWAGRRVVAFAGRVHLYEGRSAVQVAYLVRLAAAAGARAIVLTNAAGALAPDYRPGDVMLLADHLNLTGATPIEPGGPFAAFSGAPFLATADLYAPRLRAAARAAAAGAIGDATLREGVYAGVRGPQYETAAEAAMLRRLGADAVGMSTVIEAIAARALGLEVAGLSLITNASGEADDGSHAAVLAAARDGASRVAALVEAVLAAL